MTLVSTASKAAPPFNGGTITQPLVIADTTNSTVGLVVQPAAGNFSDIVEVLTDTGSFVVGVSSLGELNIVSSGAGRIPLRVIADAAQSLNLVEVADAGDTGLSGYNQNCYWWTKKTAAPADAELVSGQMMLWFDQTNGVGNTKLMVKAKSADGTVKTAALLLA